MVQAIGRPGGIWRRLREIWAAAAGAAIDPALTSSCDREREAPQKPKRDTISKVAQGASACEGYARGQATSVITGRFSFLQGMCGTGRSRGAA
jgi:hypothetical protein